MENKTFKILSIDGGGIKGLYSALIIQQLEEQYGPISDYFDMICGTSTGGLIAMGLSIKKPSSEIVKFYNEEGPKIFTKNRFYSRLYRTLKQTLFFGKYNNAKLKRAFIQMFEDLTLGHAHTLLCIPSFNLTKGMPRMFKYPHKEGKFHMDRDIKMVDVGLATSAAPTFFPIAKIGDAHYIDGGVWCNNPSFVGLLEALEHFVGPGKNYSTYSILSISSINKPSGWNTNIRQNKSFIGWRDKIIQTSLNGQSFFTEFLMEKLVKYTNPPGYYFRIPSPVLSVQQSQEIEMDIASKNAISLLNHLGKSTGAQYRIKTEIETFFKTYKTYKTQEDGKL
ncbi:MAG: CBASS cGAMP-activated phospholipase [Bacteroidota bacterium]